MEFERGKTKASVFSFEKVLDIDGYFQYRYSCVIQGIILREPSVVAVDTRTDTVRYVGQEAKDVIGRTPGSIVAVRPLKDGVIADFDITANMLQIFIKKVTNSSFFSRPNVVVCIPSVLPLWSAVRSGRPPSRRRPEGCHH